MRKMKDSGVDWMGYIPSSWKSFKLKNAATIKSGELISKEEYVDDGEYEIVGANGCIGRTNRFNNEKPVITTGRVGTIGTAYKTTKSWITDNALIISSNDDSTLEYLYWVLPNFDYAYLTTATTMNTMAIFLLMLLAI